VGWLAWRRKGVALDARKRKDFWRLSPARAATGLTWARPPPPWTASTILRCAERLHAGTGLTGLGQREGGLDLQPDLAGGERAGQELKSKPSADVDTQCRPLSEARELDYARIRSFKWSNGDFERSARR